MPLNIQEGQEPTGPSQKKANPVGLSDSQLERLGMDICAEIQSSHDEHESLTKRWERLVKIFELDGAVTNLNIVPGFATYPMALSRQKLEQIIGQVHKTVTGFEPYVQCLPLGQSDDEAAAAVRLQGALQQLATLDPGRRGFDRAFRMCLKLAVNTGVVIMYVYVDKEAGCIRFECIAPQDFVFYPAEMVDMMRAKTIGHKTWFMASEIAAKMDSGDFLKLTVGSEDSYNSHAGLSERQTGQVQTTANEPGDDKIKCYQVVRKCRFAKPGQEEDGTSDGSYVNTGAYEDEKDYLVLVSYDDQRVLKIEELPYKEGRMYFDLRLEEDYGSFWPGSSPGNLLQGPQLMFADIATTIAHAGLATAFPETDVIGESAPTGTKIQRRGPGSRTYHPNSEVKVVTTQSQFNGSWLIEALKIVSQIADELSRITPVGTSEPLKSGTSGTEAAAFFQEKQQGKDQYTSFIIPGIAEVFRFMIELLRVHFPTITKKQGKLGLKDHNDTKVKVRVEPTGKSTAANPQSLMSKLQAADQIAADPEKGFDKRKIGDFMMRALELPIDIEQLKKTEPSVTEVAMVMQGLLTWLQWQQKGGQGDPPKGTVSPDEAQKIVQEVQHGLVKGPPKPLNSKGESQEDDEPPSLAGLGQGDTPPPPQQPGQAEAIPA